MTVLDRLVLSGWLRPLAPRVAESEGCTGLSVRATAALAPSYGGRAELSASVGACLRRAICAGLANAGARGDPRQQQKRVLQGERAVLHWLDQVAELTSMSELLQTLRVPSDERVVAETLEAWEHVAGEVLPRSGPLGLATLIDLLEDALPGLDGDSAAGARRDLAGAYSLQGDRQRAIAGFEACGDRARELLERADLALESGSIAQAESLASQALATSEDAPTRGAAHRKLGSAATRDGRFDEAEDHFRAALSACGEADLRGRAEALEELSELAARLGQIDRSVALLGELRRVARQRVDLTDEARALSMAGRLLCERGKPGEGLVMLAQAKEWSDLQNPELAELIEQYVVGFQYTLSHAEWEQIQPLLEGARTPLIEKAFAAARCRAPFPPWASP